MVLVYPSIITRHRSIYPQNTQLSSFIHNEPRGDATTRYDLAGSGCCTWVRGQYLSKTTSPRNSPKQRHVSSVTSELLQGLLLLVLPPKFARLISNTTCVP
jgi:hypothetical protein